MISDLSTVVFGHFEDMRNYDYFNQNSVECCNEHTRDVILATFKAEGRTVNLTHLQAAVPDFG